MQRHYKAYLKDILENIGKIEKYTSGLSFDDFAENELIQDAVVRNLEIIGEAVKKIREKLETENQEWIGKRLPG